MNTSRRVRPLLAALALLAGLGACGDADSSAADTMNDGALDAMTGNDVASDTTGGDADAPDIPDVPDAEDAVDAVDAEDADGGPGDSSDAGVVDVMDASDATDVGDATDVSDAMDAMDTADTTDAGGGDPPHPWFGLSGEILLLETYSAGAGEVVNSGVGASLADGPDPQQHTLMNTVGACELWTYQATQCTPACAASEVCDASATCAAFPTPQSAGDITVSGLTQAVMFTQSDGFYVLSSAAVSGALFTAGAAITASAPGDDVAALSLQVTGVADFSVQGVGLVELKDTEDFTISWAPTAAPGDEVEFLLQLGWHGAPPAGIIYCRADDDVGSVVIDTALIVPFPKFSGIGLFQHGSVGQRVSRHIIQTSAGPVALTAASRQTLSVTH